MAKTRAGRRAVLLLGLMPVFAATAQAREDTPPSVQAAIPLKLSGYGQVQYSHAGSATDSLSLPRVRFSVDGSVTRTLRAKVQADITRSPALLDAQFELTLFKHGSLRVGQFKVPFSQESLTSASDHEMIVLPRSVLSLSPGRDIGASGRDIGATLLIRSGRIEAFAGVFNGAGINKVDTNKQKDLAGRLVFSPLEALKIGGSVYRGHYSETAGQTALRRDRAGLEMALGLSRLTLRGEYILAQDGANASRGGYALAGYTFVPDTLQVLVIYDSLDRRKAQAPGRNDTWTLGLNWFLAAKTKLQLDLEINRDEEAGKGTTVSFLALFQAGF